MQTNKTRRQSSAINAGSMADIAFLLLIFLLVTTTIASDQGILVKLPAYDPNPPSMEIRSRNILRVLINADNKLLVRGKAMSIDILKDEVKAFILNPNQDENKSSSPQFAIISLVHDRGTNYEAYLSIYNELKAAYNELWDEMANLEYGRNYASLNRENQRKIHKKIPIIISESEPTAFGQGGCEVVFYDKLDANYYLSETLK